MQQLLDQPRLVVGVENGEIALEPDQLGVTAKNPHTDGMKRSEEHAVSRTADQAGDTIQHLAGGLVGEGDGQNLRRTGAAGEKLVGNPRRQDARFAGAGACQHKQGAAIVGDGLALLLVQPVEIGCGYNGASHRLRFGRGGVVGDFERIGGGRHARSYSNRNAVRLSFRGKPQMYTGE